MQRFLFFILLFLFSSHSLLGQTNSPLTKCWEFLTENMSSFKIASDNHKQIFIPLADSKIVALDKDGKIIWKSEVGGNLISDLKIFGDYLIFAVRNEIDIKETKLRAVSRETGLTIWNTELPDNNSISVEILNLGDEILVVTEKGLLFNFGNTNGKLVNQDNFQTEITSNIELVGELLYFANQNNQVQEYSLITKKSNHFQFERPISRLYFHEQNYLIIADQLGRLIQFDILKQKKGWILRTGGVVNSITFFNGRYYISSNDNYVYCLSFDNGEIVWRKRLSGRTEGEILINSDGSQYISAVITGQLAIVSDLVKGKTLSQLMIDGDLYFIREPLVVSKDVYFSLNKGVVYYSQSGC